MSKISDIRKNELIPKLKGVDGLNVLDGWFVNYVHKFSKTGQKLKFPLASVQPKEEVTVQSKSGLDGINARAFTVIGATSVREPETVNDELDDLLFKVRQALAINAFDNESEAHKLEFGDVKFDLPERGDEYAFFELTIRVSYTERWQPDDKQ
ncbi:hypothetical protein A134_23120 [Vibrio crassostreae 9CS106]|uniref:Phage tail protein n=1 Tax=Vibrio crassostreae 9CS106 TaxID=1191300 RepID=A0A1B1C374_9VIBR|nr:hypothetical protein A134_23120 [Vibrio crassostreae 9CS106]